jgi:protein O-GlcNAc transferase
MVVKKMSNLMGVESKSSAGLPQLINQAVSLHQKGALAEAERLYFQILKTNPDHFDAQHFLGVLRYQQGDNTEALDLIGKALQTKPNAATALSNYGLVLAALKRFEDALTSYDKALAIKPDYAEALYGRGNSLRDLGRLEDALTSYDKALAIKPDFAGALNNRGSILRELRRLEDALTSYDKALAIKPDDAETLNNRGNTLRDLGRFEDALASFDKALAIKPDFAEALHNRGVALKDLKRFEDALASYDKALTIKPEFAAALHNRGVALQDLKRHEDALTSYDKALAIKPDYAEALYGRGNTLRDLGRLEDALASYDKALAIKPDDAAALNNRGIVLRDLGRYEDALASYHKVLAIKPDYAAALNNRGVALRDLRRFEDALASYDKAKAIKPDFAEALNNRGAALQDLRRFEEALESYDKALAIKPAFAEALNNRGNALRELNRFEDALASYDKALAIKPHDAETLNSRGNTLRDLGRFEDALASFEKALVIKPDHLYSFSGLAKSALNICDWTRTTKLAREMRAHVVEGKCIVRPFTLLEYCDDASIQMKCARSYIQDRMPALPKPLWRDATWRNDRIKIAYLSADFREHAVARLIAELFERHDRSHFEVIGVSFGPDDRSELRTRIIKAVDQFHDVRRVPDYDVAQMLSRMQTDIVVDLMGYTKYCRPEILSYRPAPIAAAYLGYPGTMAAGFIDYIIADKIVVPFKQQPFYTEKIAYLPDSYQVNDSQRRVATETPRRETTGLPERGFVFCCFNNSQKINPPVFEVWMRLLSRVDGSVLWLLSANEAACDRLRSEAAQRGIDPARIVFAERKPLAEHLARHRLADLFLDTLPYNAHTTASDALWAGLLVLTCCGRSFAGRVATSLLYAVGLPELVTANLEEYEALAVRLATDPSLLAGFKQRLERNRLKCPLFDTNRFRRHIEVAYKRMWEIWQRGESPRSFSVKSQRCPPLQRCVANRSIQRSRS